MDDLKDLTAQGVADMRKGLSDALRAVSRPQPDWDEAIAALMAVEAIAFCARAEIGGRVDNGNGK